MGLNEDEQAIARVSGMLHDVGKIGISNEVIYKPDRLDQKEYELMKSHPEMSVDIIQPMQGEAHFKEIVEGVRHHHERIDGKGYPYGLEGGKIPLMARLLAVVDTYDAMGATRPYRKGLPKEVIYKEFKRCSGSQFDKHLIKVFLDSHKFWLIQADQQIQMNDWFESAA